MEEDWQQEMEVLFLSKLFPEWTSRCAIWQCRWLILQLAPLLWYLHDPVWDILLGFLVKIEDPTYVQQLRSQDKHLPS